jgi:hypothetical protein
MLFMKFAHFGRECVTTPGFFYVGVSTTPERRGDGVMT